MSVAQVTDGGGKWEVGGVEFDTDGCAQGDYVIGMCAPRPGDHAKGKPQGLNTMLGPDPFAVYVRTECNAVGFPEAAPIARRRLELVEPRAVEEFYSREVLGRLDDDRHHRPLGTKAVPFAYAVGLLEQHAGMHYGGTPILHAPRWTAPLFPVQDPVYSNPPVLRTMPLGTPVAFGTAYLDDPIDGVLPRHAAIEGAGGTDGVFWLFVTGSVRVRRADVRVYEVFDPTTNTKAALAERPFSIETDCFIAGVRVDVRRQLGLEGIR
jgi:hypothetical protein